MCSPGCMPGIYTYCNICNTAAVSTVSAADSGMVYSNDCKSACKISWKQDKDNEKTWNCNSYSACSCTDMCGYIWYYFVYCCADESAYRWPAKRIWVSSKQYPAGDERPSRKDKYNSGRCTEYVGKEKCAAQRVYTNCVKIT